MFGSSTRSTHWNSHSRTHAHPHPEAVRHPHAYTHTHAHHAGTHGHGTHRANRIRGLQAAINNPRTTHDGRREAEHEVRAMGARPKHPSLGTRLRHLFHLPAKSHRARGAVRRY